MWAALYCQLQGFWLLSFLPSFFFEVEQCPLRAAHGTPQGFWVFSHPTLICRSKENLLPCDQNAGAHRRGRHMKYWSARSQPAQVHRHPQAAHRLSRQPLLQHFWDTHSLGLDSRSQRTCMENMHLGKLRKMLSWEFKTSKALWKKQATDITKCKLRRKGHSTYRHTANIHTQSDVLKTKGMQRDRWES